MNRQEIIDAYLFLREHNHDISDATLDFMKDVSLRELERVENCRVCFSCIHDGLQQWQEDDAPCKDCYEYSNFKVKT